MPVRFSAVMSTIGKKILMSLTGLAMFSFVVAHLLGNLQLLSGDPDPYNKYAHLLISAGVLLIVAELVLLGSLLVHVWAAITTVWDRWKARPLRYARLRSAGDPSRKTVGSSTMIYTGAIILVFVVVHLVTFKYGPGVEAGYVTQVDGVEMRDLHRLVVEDFSNPWYVIGYVVAMIVLGFHLSHAFWSAFQSLGLNHPQYTPLLYTGGRIMGFLIALGYLAIPVWIYFAGAAQ